MNTKKELDNLNNKFEEYLYNFWNNKKEKIISNLTWAEKTQIREVNLISDIGNFLREAYRIWQEKVLEEVKHENLKEFSDINDEEITKTSLSILEKIGGHIEEKTQKLFSEYLWETEKLISELKVYLWKWYIIKSIASNELKTISIKWQLDQFDYLRKKLNLKWWKMRDAKEDDKTSDMCKLNEADWWINYDKLFISWHFAPPWHVNCRCDLKLSLLKLDWLEGIKGYTNFEVTYWSEKDKEAMRLIYYKFYNYWIYCDNIYSFNTHNIFKEIIVNPEHANIKFNKDIRKHSEFIDKNKNWKLNWKMININWEELYLSDFWNLLYWYLWEKIKYDYLTIRWWALLATASSWDFWFKKEWVFKNESRDAVFYKAWFELWEEVEAEDITIEKIVEAIIEAKNKLNN